MPLRLDPEDLERLGPKAREQIAAAMGGAAGQAPVPEEPSSSRRPPSPECSETAASQSPPQDQPPGPAAGGRRGTVGAFVDWVAPIEGGPGDSGDDPRPPQRAARRGPGSRWMGVGAGVAAALVSGAGVWSVVGAGAHPPVAGQGTATAVTVPSGAVAGGRSAPASVGPSKAELAAMTAKAEADDQAATTAAAQAAQTVLQAQGQVRAAQGASQQVESLAAPALARQPAATAPSSALGPVTAAASSLTSASSAVQGDLSRAMAAADAAAQVAAADAAAGQASAAAQAAVGEAKAALEQVHAAVSQVSAWEGQGEAAITAWQQVHSAPPGYFGMAYADPPSDWTVQGCEVITANPGAPAAGAGLIGRDQRIDPVGDVITSITDTTDVDTTWPVPNCAALQSAVAQTRAGDQVTIDYYHRLVVLLFGQWVPDSGSTTLTNGSDASCPPALTGTITSQLTNNRIQLSVALTGTGTAQTFTAFLDTGAGVTTFPDAYLRSAGYAPFASTTESGVVPGAQVAAYLYHLPGGALQVKDRGSYVPMATGTLLVTGIPGESLTLLGPDVLKHGAKFSTSGSQWTLTPPCG